MVMESTAQYWRPVWEALERVWSPERHVTGGPLSGALHLAQAQSNRGPRGRKKDFPDAERLVKRLVAQELILSFVPDAEQRLWRTIMRRKYQVTRKRVQFQNRLECLLEEAHLKLSSLVSDLLGISARRMLKALADGETNPATIAALADQRLRATRANCPTRSVRAGSSSRLSPALKMALEELQLIEAQIDVLDQEMARLLSPHQDAVQRLAEVPGSGVDSAQQIIAEVGPEAATFPRRSTWPPGWGVSRRRRERGRERSHRSPKGNRQMRRLLNQAANAAVKTKGSIFELVFGGWCRGWHAQAIGAIAHRLCRLIWKICIRACLTTKGGRRSAKRRDGTPPR